MLPLASVEATRNTGDKANLVIAAGIVAPRFVAADRLRRRGGAARRRGCRTGSTALLRKPASAIALAERATALLARAAAPCR